MNKPGEYTLNLTISFIADKDFDMVELTEFLKHFPFMKTGYKGNLREGVEMPAVLFEPREE